MHKQLLHQNWTFRAVGELPAEVPDNVRGRDIAATVPGCVHTDLLAAGLIPDPFYDRNELDLQWIGLTDWQYRCTFDADAKLLSTDKLELVADGLDTIGEIELNGEAIGSVNDMHLAWRFDVRGKIKPAGNELVITFASAYRHAYAMEEKFGPRPHVERDPFNYIRKMHCNFGWDWGPRLVTAGVWKPISLAGWNAVRIEAVRPQVLAADARSATLEVNVDLAHDGDGEVEIEVTLHGPDGRSFNTQQLVAGDEATVTLPLIIPKPQLWWPIGHGEQPLYNLEVKLGGLDEWSGRVGLRTTRLRTDRDQTGTSFGLEINDKPIFCKGANWIPDDTFPTRMTRERYRRRLEQAATANMNMLRIWGGGIFESDDFYELCDELGLMVWQDFLFACATYEEGEPFGSLVEAEARQNVSRLCHHPSLVIWNGCNENIWAYQQWGESFSWKERIGERTWGLGFYMDLLPRVVKELDPARPYWPGSPYSGTMELLASVDEHGNKHVWDAWNASDYGVYTSHPVRFSSEFGYQGPPTWAAIEAAIPPDQRSVDSDSMRHHQKQRNGVEKIRTRMSERYPVPDELGDWLYVGQLNQAHAVEYAVTFWRSLRPACMGTLYWQLNDCWPVVSWAAIDSTGKPKLLWYASKRMYRERVLAFHEVDGRIQLSADNDGGEDWQGTVSVRRLRFYGTVLGERKIELDVKAQAAARLLVISDAPELRPEAPADEMLVADVAGERAVWFFAPNKDLTLPRPQFEASLEQDGNLYRLTVTAGTLLVDLCVMADRLDADAQVLEQMVTLLGGESYTFEILSARQLTVEELTDPGVLKCANSFAAGK